MATGFAHRVLVRQWVARRVVAIFRMQMACRVGMDARAACGDVARDNVTPMYGGRLEDMQTKAKISVQHKDI